MLQVDNLNITHENFKLELEKSHSEKVEELKKEYESSFSGKYFVSNIIAVVLLVTSRNIQAFPSVCPLHYSWQSAIFKNLG